MKRLVIFQLLILSCLLTADLCMGQQTLRLKNGGVLQGEVIECSDKYVIFRYQDPNVEDGVVESKFNLTALDPFSFYTLWAEAMPDTADAHLGLAKFALKNKMYAAAVLQYKRAKALDPQMIAKWEEDEGIKMVDQYTQKLLADAKIAIEKGLRRKAESNLETLLTYFPKSKAAKEAEAVIQKLAAEGVQEGKFMGDDKDMISVLLTDGSSRNGYIEAVDDDSVRIKVARGGGVFVTTSIHVDKIAPQSFFEIQAQFLGDDPARHLKLIKYAIENDMFARAFYLYERLKAIDPIYVENMEKDDLPRIKERIAETMVASAKAVMADAKGKADLYPAVHDLSRVLTRFDDTKAAEEARTLLDQLEQRFMEMVTAEESRMIAKLTEERKDQELKAYKEGLKRLDPAKRSIANGQKRNLQAMKNTRTNRSIDEFMAAAREFQKAISELDSLRTKHADDSKLVAVINELHDEAVNDAVSAYLNAGRAYMQRTSFNQAEDCADRALKLDPGNGAATSFKAEVQTNILNSAAWDDRRGGGRRRGR